MIRWWFYSARSPFETNTRVLLESMAPAEAAATSIRRDFEMSAPPRSFEWTRTRTVIDDTMTSLRSPDENRWVDVVRLQRHFREIR